MTTKRKEVKTLLRIQELRCFEIKAEVKTILTAFLQFEETEVTANLCKTRGMRQYSLQIVCPL